MIQNDAFDFNEQNTPDFDFEVSYYIHVVFEWNFDMMVQSWNANYL